MHPLARSSTGTDSRTSASSPLALLGGVRVRGPSLSASRSRSGLGSGSRASASSSVGKADAEGGTGVDDETGMDSRGRSGVRAASALHGDAGAGASPPLRRQVRVSLRVGPGNRLKSVGRLYRLLEKRLHRRVVGLRWGEQSLGDRNVPLAATGLPLDKEVELTVIVLRGTLAASLASSSPMRSRSRGKGIGRGGGLSSGTTPGSINSPSSGAADGGQLAPVIVPSTPAAPAVRTKQGGAVDEDPDQDAAKPAGHRSSTITPTENVTASPSKGIAAKSHMKSEAGNDPLTPSGVMSAYGGAMQMQSPSSSSFALPSSHSAQARPSAHGPSRSMVMVPPRLMVAFPSSDPAVHSLLSSGTDTITSL